MVPFFLTTIAALMAGYLSCAHQVSPGGGPEDKTGPTVLTSRPLPGAVNVSPTSVIEFTFSEWISRTAAARSVSILPPVDGGVKIRVSGRRLQIVPSSALADSTTYHIVVTSQLVDLRNNPLSASITLVFSTGPSLDSGHVAGCIVDPASPRRAQATVALYKTGDSIADSAIFGEPRYLTQTDSASFFSFEHVRAGRYRLIGFIDQNNNRRLDPGREAAFAPVTMNIAVENRPDTVTLFPVSSDTASARIASVFVSSPTMLWVSVTKPPDTTASLRWRIEPIQNKGSPIAVRTTRWIGRFGLRCLLTLDDSLALAPYRLILEKVRGEGVQRVSWCDTMRFNGARPLDTVRPALVSVAPTGFMAMDDTIRLFFTEPVAVASPLTLVDSLRDTVALELISGFSDTLIGRPQRRLRPGHAYRLVVRTSHGTDAAGNPLQPRDTTDTVQVPVFRVIDADSLALSLKGCVPCLAPDAARRWMFLPFGRGRAIHGRDSSGCFSFDSMFAGKGFLAYFLDANENGVPDQGSLVPWRPPEPYVVMTDTIEARARWEIENVVPHSACARCKKHEPGQKATPRPAGE